MIDYKVVSDKENKRFIVTGAFEPNSIPIEIPNDNPLKNKFIDLFLHKADIEKGIEFLQCISIDKNITVNEGLFIAGLNNCMKCFKHSKSRIKLDKNIIFNDSEQVLKEFLKFEEMRDKHFGHDENGMLQTVAFLLISKEKDSIFSGPPSVVWNRVGLNYYLAAAHLQNIMLFIKEYIVTQIDEIGNQIIANYKNCSIKELLTWKTAQIKVASDRAERK